MLHVVIGANGAVGQEVMAELGRRAIPSKGAGTHPRGGWIKLDLLSAEDCLQGLEGASHVHMCTGFRYDLKVWQRDWPLAMSNLVQAAAKNGTKVVFLDNLYAYGPAPLQVPITEEHPLKPPSQKGLIRKQIAEQLVTAHRDGRVQALIARAPDFYGPNAQNSLLYALMLQPMLQNRMTRWLGKSNLPHSFGYTPDIGRAMVELSLADDAYGQVWHTPTKAPAPTAEQLHAILAREMGVTPKLAVMGRFALGFLGIAIPALREVKEMAYQYFDPYEFSSAKFEARFPEFAITAYDEGLREMVRSFRPGPSA